MKKLTTIRKAVNEARREMQNTLLEAMSSKEFLTAKEIGKNCEADARTVAGIIISCRAARFACISSGPKKHVVTKYAKVNEDGTIDPTETIVICRKINTYRKNIERI